MLEVAFAANALETTDNRDQFAANPTTTFRLDHFEISSFKIKLGTP
ncbi:hypothetical protein LCGC14_1414100 [marine sediment metagenome]|uniref:Uncharacterized protein n=1 Tax=marine sediment metagenome TaxID=412755 RepID=A0A0F9JTC0_9ZZZZ